MIRLAMMLFSFIVSCIADNPGYNPDAGAQVPMDMGVRDLAAEDAQTPPDAQIAKPDSDTDLKSEDLSERDLASIDLSTVDSSPDLSSCTEKLVNFQSNCFLTKAVGGDEFQLNVSMNVPAFMNFMKPMEFYFTPGKCPMNPNDTVQQPNYIGALPAPINANNYGGIFHLYLLQGMMKVPDMKYLGVNCLVPHFTTACGDSKNYKPMDTAFLEVMCQ